MLQYSIYSVISPEGCASILYKSAEKAEVAAGALGLTATKLKRQGLVDSVIREPLGGAHRDPAQTAQRMKELLINQLEALDRQTDGERLDTRYQRLMQMGALDRE